MSEHVRDGTHPTPPPGARTLRDVLGPAQAAGYAVPAFSPRYLALIEPVVEAAVRSRAPFIVEISQRELGWFALDPETFRNEVERVVTSLAVDVPYALHLDHTWEEDRIDRAIAAGFTSVMFDASARPFEENVARTREVVTRAHARGVSVEAELGTLTTTDRMELEGGPDTYTDPDQAARFVSETGCDALAIAVGTAHGNYPASGPTIDFERLAAIGAAVGDTPLVLHGGSGLPIELVRRAIGSDGGGIAKMNIATDLEGALLAAIGGQRRTSAELDEVPAGALARGLDRVRTVAEEKIRLLGAANRA